MSNAARRAMTLDEFLAWDDTQAGRWEFDGFEPVAMTDVTQAHAILQANLFYAIGARLKAKGGPCRFLGPELRITTALGTARCPDGIVACGPIVPRARNQPDPVVLFEILSDSTGATDRVLKAREYRATPSVRRYVMLEQTRVAIATLTRGADGVWTPDELLEGDSLHLPEIGLEPIPLAELYAGLPFEDAPP